mgnify:CR=1 FL=1
MVLTDSDELARSVWQLADYGQSDKFVHKNIGFNSRLDTIQAAVLLCKLPYLRQWTEARRRAARLYQDKLQDLPVKIAKTADNTDPVFHLFVVSLEDRYRIIEGLRNNGVMAQIHYPSVIHLQHCYNFLGYKRGDFPAAEHNATHCLSLPIYPEIRDEQIECVVETLSKIM